MKILKLVLSLLAACVIGFAVGWMYAPVAAVPSIVLGHVKAAPTLYSDGGTVIEITTGYRNSGCDAVLLSRFLLNTKPTPSIALPQRHGSDVLPRGRDVSVERVALGFPLSHGQWHLFSVVSCYVDGIVVPGGTVSPTALFEIT